MCVCMYVCIVCTSRVSIMYCHHYGSVHPSLVPLTKGARRTSRPWGRPEQQLAILMQRQCAEGVGCWFVVAVVVVVSKHGHGLAWVVVVVV